MSLFSSTAAVIGGLPNDNVDIPVCSVFLCLYAAAVVLNLSLFFINRRRGHKFFMSVMLYALSLIRVASCAMRIGWARNPQNYSLAIASQVFNNAGTLIIYILNLIFAQRILRAKQPRIGWNRALSVMLYILYGLIVATLVMSITALVISINSPSPSTLNAIRSVSLAAATFLLVMVAIPFLLLSLALLRATSPEEETFGEGSMTVKVVVLLTSSTLAAVIAGFKAGTTWEPPRLSANPAWYHSKAAFYCFGFMLEVLVLALFLGSRVDRRFHVPDRCKRPGDYTRLGHHGTSQEEGSENGQSKA